MPGSISDRPSTRSTSVDDSLIERVIEKVLINPSFLEKLTSAIASSLKRLEEQSKECQTEVVSLQHKCDKLSDAIEQQEQYSRNNNLRIFGVPQSKNEVVEDVIINMLQDKLGLNVRYEVIDCATEKVSTHPSSYVLYVDQLETKYILQRRN